MAFLDKYNTLVFDCDGVILDSNGIKTNALYKSASVYGEAPARALVEYHLRNGGISRYEKLAYFIRDILGKDIDQAELDDLLMVFAKEVKQGLFTCAVAEGVEELRAKTRNAKWLIVSGGDQSELREVFAARGLDRFFDGGIFGSPDDKDLILHREIASRANSRPGLFVGDSRYDFLAADKAGMDFIFLSGWTEFSEYKEFFLQKEVRVLAKLEDLVALEC